MTFSRLLICSGLYFAILFATFFIDLFMNRKKRDEVGFIAWILACAGFAIGLTVLLAQNGVI